MGLRELAEGLDELAMRNVSFDGFDKVVSDLNKGNNFGVGAGYTLQNIIDNADNLDGSRIKFEDTIRVGETAATRRIDVTVIESSWFGLSKKNVYLEYKSVGKLPPQHFGKQFVNDLLNTDVKELNQVQWRFDKSKVSSADLAANKTGMLGKVEARLGALDKGQLENLVKSLEKDLLDIPDGASKSDLVDMIVDGVSDNFDQMITVQ